LYCAALKAEGAHEVSAAVVGLGGAPELGHVGFPIVGAGRISLPNVSEWKDTGKPLLRVLIGCDASEEKPVDVIIIIFVNFCKFSAKYWCFSQKLMF
jgi:hypothetical protein